ncbi:hypothetical protein QC763_114840 [Podospora pseudopauciseta]|uniref:Uncharacterized protein n=2 Tax=Podospora TaxID=5144 RepID=A0ABR0I085_9PEZI|nr:hypothetical protein QC763_114840 [Podospora pseudopauciseta]KAK4682266.1 hypothetical protein QC764_114840 [Podospora pseudoanserina]
MALSPMQFALIQAAVIGSLSNIIAQVIAAQRDNKLITINLLSLFQYVLFGLVNTPPNILWQEYLESTFPSYHPSPTPEAIASASKGSEAELDAEEKEGKLVEPKLNRRNTAIKTLLDQTVGAAVNTFLYSMFMNGIQMGMAHHELEAQTSLGFLFGEKGVVRAQDVNWGVVWERTRGEFWGIVKAGWKFWPVISLVNFTFLKSVEMRNLVGGLAGVGWGVYVNLFAGN